MADKFMGFYLTNKRIETNLDKREAATQMKAPTSKKYIQMMNGTFIALNMFTSKSAQQATPFL